MHWLLIALTTAFAYGAYNFFVKLTSGHIHQVAGAVILQGTALVIGAALLLVLKITGSEIQITPAGIKFAVCAGASTAIAEVLFIYLFSKGVRLTVGVPVVVGGAVLFATILALVILKEPLTARTAIGILCIILGIAALS